MLLHSWFISEKRRRKGSRESWDHSCFLHHLLSTIYTTPILIRSHSVFTLPNPHLTSPNNQNLKIKQDKPPKHSSSSKRYYPVPPPASPNFHSPSQLPCNDRSTPLRFGTSSWCGTYLSFLSISDGTLFISHKPSFSHSKKRQRDREVERWKGKRNLPP